MKIITLLLMMLTVNVAQAVKIYKCPGKVEGQYTYQEKACKGAKVDEHTLGVVPSNEKKIAEAQAKLAQEIAASKEKEKSTATPTDAKTPVTTGDKPAPTSQAAPTSQTAPLVEQPSYGGLKPQNISSKPVVGLPSANTTQPAIPPNNPPVQNGNATPTIGLPPANTTQPPVPPGLNAK